MNNDFDFDDISGLMEELNKEHTPDCKIVCGKETRYNNIVDCAKDTGDSMAKSGDFEDDIVIYYQGKARAIRKYIHGDYDDKSYQFFLNVIDPCRQPCEAKDPVILKCGYYTDWIAVI